MECSEKPQQKYFCSVMLQNDYFLCMTIFNMSFNDTVQRKFLAIIVLYQTGSLWCCHWHERKRLSLCLWSPTPAQGTRALPCPSSPPLDRPPGTSCCSGTARDILTPQVYRERAASCILKLHISEMAPRWSLSWYASTILLLDACQQEHQSWTFVQSAITHCI